MANQHYMKPEKGEGDIVKVPANEWGNYRAKGYVFSSKDEYDAQVIAKGEAAEKDASKKKAKKKTSS